MKCWRVGGRGRKNSVSVKHGLRFEQVAIVFQGQIQDCRRGEHRAIKAAKQARIFLRKVWKIF